MTETPARKPGKRRRQLRLTLVLLAVVVLVAVTVSIFLFRSPGPAPYRPGEKPEGITSSLSLQLPPGTPVPRFTEVSAEAGLDFRQFNGPRGSQLPEDMGSGAAWCDYDGDGDEDLLLVASGGALTLPEPERAPCELYQNQGDGTFRRDPHFPRPRIIGMGAAWADYDGDGAPDLVITGYNSLLLYHNRGGKLEKDPRFTAPPGFWAGAAWGDYDNDGDPDLYVCGYVRYEEVKTGALKRPAGLQYGREVPYTLNPSSYPPERNLLFRNNGDGTFTETAAAFGVDNPTGRSLGALWHDFNDDGLPDLYVANDISDNALYLNTGKGFTDAGHAAWVADYRGAMGLAAGDWNGDGDDDLFITHWIAQENALYDSMLAETSPKSPPSQAKSFAGSRGRGAPSAAKCFSKEPLAAGGTLRFMDAADMAGLGQVALHRVGWGTEFADLDADGFPDLLVANGSTFETADNPPKLRPQAPFLFRNNRGKSFNDLVPLSDALAQKRVGRGLAVCDYDRDGDLDFLIVNHSEGVQLFRNDGFEPHGNWVILVLRPGRPGTRVIARVGDRQLRRTVGGASYLSQSSPRVHLGLGAATRVDSLEIRYPGGGTGTYTHIEANSYWEITEGNPTPRKLDFTATAAGRPGRIPGNMSHRERVARFWQTQRAAMRAMKEEGDLDRAIGLFKDALALDPAHEDSLYYLGQALRTRGDVDGALDTFETLVRINPSGHRGLRQVGYLRARSARDNADLAAARKVLERALAINPEETGVPFLLAEIDILQGQSARAGDSLARICRVNPRSRKGFYLRGYIAWKNGDLKSARDFLARSRQDNGAPKQPQGSSAEGDVQTRMHRDDTLLSDHFRFPPPGGDAGDIPQPAFFYSQLDNHIKKYMKTHKHARN